MMRPATDTLMKTSALRSYNKTKKHTFPTIQVWQQRTLSDTFFHRCWLHCIFFLQVFCSQVISAATKALFLSRNCLTKLYRGSPYAMPGMVLEVDVCIVGAGLSGLSCAYYLRKLNPYLKIVVLEARERVGGRCHTVPCGQGVVDVGGQWVGARQPLVTALISDLGLELTPQVWLGLDSECDATSGARDTFVADMPMASMPAPLTAIESQSVTATVHEIDSFSQTVPLHAPWTCARACEWDSISVDEYFLAKHLAPAALLELRLGIQTILATECHDLSLLYFLFFVHCAGGFRNLSDGPGGAQVWTMLHMAMHLFAPHKHAFLLVTQVYHSHEETTSCIYQFT
jgi:hypothetical protein